MNAAELPMKHRCAFALAVVEHLPEALTNDPAAAAIARRGLAVADSWVRGEAVLPEKIAQFYESDTPNDLGMREGQQKEKGQLQALVAIVAAIGYVAWHAYQAAGRHDMTESLCEVGEQTLDEVVRSAKASGFVGEEDIEKALTTTRARNG